MRRTFQRAAWILLASASLGFLLNAISPPPRRIPWVRPPKPALTANDQVTLDKARALWETGGAIFLDARSEKDYRSGHIPGALNLPAMTFGASVGKIRPKLDAEMKLVLYCDGEHCDSSRQLKDNLRAIGLTNSVILASGWTLWREARLPVRQGNEP